MRYQRPMIIGREPIAGLMKDSSNSDKAAESDVHLKENIIPVAWSTPYESPAIVDREPVKGLLDTRTSENVKSDVHLKENVVPVAWSAPYESPAIIDREPIAGLLEDVSRSDRPTDN